MSFTTPPGPETDPGLLRGLAEGTPLAHLRLVGLTMSAGALIVLVLGAVVLAEPTVGPVDVTLVPLMAAGLVAVGAAVLLPVPALPRDLPADEAPRRSRNLFQQRTFMRVALCEVPVLLGLVGAVIDPTAGLTPLLNGALLSGLALPLVALPTRPVIERFRTSLEAQGARSYLWEGLRGQAPGGA